MKIKIIKSNKILDSPKQLLNQIKIFYRKINEYWNSNDSFEELVKRLHKQKK